MVKNVPDPQRNMIGLFIGSGLNFSDTAIRLVCEEIPCITFRRVSSFADLFRLAEQEASDVRIIIVDEGKLEQFQRALARITTRFENSRLALAYRDKTKALKVIADVAQFPGSEEIGFLPMRVELDHWLSALRLLICGERYIPADLIDNRHLPLAPCTAAPAPAPDINLTSREYQVLSSAAEGKQNKIIAGDLGLSEHTVKLHMHHIIAKLGVSNRTEATLWYLSHRPQSNGSRQ